MRTINNYSNAKLEPYVLPDLARTEAVMTAANQTIQKGQILGVSTATKKFRRVTRTVVGATAFAANSPTGTVTDASVFAVGDILKNEAGDNVGTISAINVVTNTITLAANAATAVATGALVRLNDGSETGEVIAQYNAASDASGRVSFGGGDESGATFHTIPVYTRGEFLKSDISGMDAATQARLETRGFKFHTAY